MTDLASGFQPDKKKKFQEASTEGDVKKYFNRRKKEIEDVSKFIPYSPYPFGEPGTPDKLGCIRTDDGRFYLLEFKRSETEKTRKNQDVRCKQWRRMGAKVLLLDNKEKVHNFIEEVKANGRAEERNYPWE